MIMKLRFPSYHCVIPVIVLSLSIPEIARAWGQDGHRIVAEIAERNLNPKAKSAIAEILQGESLAEISTWADDIRSDGTWDFALPWHYISIDDEESWKDFERVPEAEGDVLSTLERLEKMLRDTEKTTFKLEGTVKRRGSSLASKKSKEVGKRDLLAFYVHFVGDIHQPLHVGRREDQGGNKIQTKWFDEEFSLHKVWDEKLIESLNLSYTEFTTFLNRPMEGDPKSWEAASYLDWARESKEIRDQVYDFGPQRKSYFLNVMEPPSLSYDYRARVMPLVKDRLRQGGFRLAAKLNAIFGK